MIADEGGDEDYDDEDDSNLDSEMLDEFDADGLNLKNSSSSGSSIKPKEEEQKEQKVEAPKAKGKTSQKNLKNIKIQQTNADKEDAGCSSPKVRATAPLSPTNAMNLAEKHVPTTAGADPSVASAYDQSE